MKRLLTAAMMALAFAPALAFFPIEARADVECVRQGNQWVCYNRDGNGRGNMCRQERNQIICN